MEDQNGKEVIKSEEERRETTKEESVKWRRQNGFGGIKIYRHGGKGPAGGKKKMKRKTRELISEYGGRKT